MLMLLALAGFYVFIKYFITTYGYAAVFSLMILESASLPVPSEIVLPLAGLLSAKGYMTFPLALMVGVAGSIVGCMIDYSIGYYIGKERLYKYLMFFKIKKDMLDSFDIWFANHGRAAVFFTRLVPVIRTIVNFPAGFEKMDLKRFLGYSVVGIIIWDFVLMVFGYYLLSGSAEIVLLSIAGFILFLYLLYNYSAKKMNLKRKH